MINIKRRIVGIIAIAAISISCNNDDDFERGNWVESSVFDGIPRSSAASFVIGNKGYVGTGYDGDDYLQDFWEYDMEGDFWVQKADFPGIRRSAATGLAIGSMGYIGLGYDGDFELSDFWEYNPTANVWTQKTDFKGGPRRAAVGFGSSSKGYVGTGYDGDNDQKDFWVFEPTTNEWTKLEGFGGDKRRDATTFQIGNKVYLGTGQSNGLNKTDFWEFDLSSEKWTRKKDLDEDDDYSIARSNATGFELNGLGYIATGYNAGAVGSIWEYNPSSDVWEEITKLEALPRQDAISFSNGSSAFVLLGRNGGIYLDDNYQLFPQEEYNEDD
ncbi:Kelch repeat-containing protein [Aquimarina hainanensis]|uniref:Kelch repeat-containing protein n=1 Tax=Aquimarina hainanensis TaxID=1578017 RepID=A0ABW5NBI7_9FLAO